MSGPAGRAAAAGLVYPGCRVAPGPRPTRDRIVAATESLYLADLTHDAGLGVRDVLGAAPLAVQAG